jgi:hypothetical protein
LTLFIVGIVLSIPIGVSVNLFTPWFKRRISQKDPSRRIAEIEQELKKIEQYINGPPSKLIAYAARESMVALSSLIFVTMFVAIAVLYQISIPTKAGNIVTDLSGVVAVTFLIGSGFQLTKTYRTFTEVHDFDSYQRKVAQQLRRLQRSSLAPGVDGMHKENPAG